MKKSAELLSYLPIFVRQYGQRHGSPINPPAEEQFQTVVLFADVSGFTALTEKLVKSGPDGVETLTECINAYFDRLITIVTDHGGDVVKFAGDAMLSIWPCESPQKLAEVTRRAAECCLLAQRRLHRYEVAPQIYLSLKLALAVGQLKIMYLDGDSQGWEIFIAGKPLEDIGLANNLAEPGEIIPSPEAWTLLSETFLAGPNDKGAMKLLAVRNSIRRSPLKLATTLPPETISTLENFVPPIVLSCLSAEQNRWLAELRLVTVLFVNLASLKVETSLEKAQQLLTLLQKVISRYEGNINKLGADDKGSILIAAFGIPPFSHEDDAQRGVQAALEIQDRLALLEEEFAIGITTGRVFCGLIGNVQRKEYTLMGDTVNLSARLMQVAGSGDILCDERTFEATKQKQTFMPQPPIEVKGKTELVQVYRPIRACLLPQYAEEVLKSKTSLVGRELEREKLVEALERLRSPAESFEVVVIEGEGGIGKSTLLNYLFRKCQKYSLEILYGSAEAIEKSTLYFPWRCIFSKLLGFHQAQDLQAQRQQVLKFLAVEPELSPLAPLLNAVLPLEFPETETTAAMVGKERANNTRQFLVRLLQLAIKKTPTVLILEDAHWMDSASWALGKLVSDRVRPLLLIIATRPLAPHPPNEYSQLLALKQAQYLQLHALTGTEALLLACQRLGAKSLPEEIALPILQKAQGNPFFTEELAYSLRDAGLIVIENGECRLAPGVRNLNSLDFPDTVQSAITSRIDLLTPSQQLVLKVASVIGRVFAFQILRDIYPIESDKDKLKDYLEVLNRFNLTILDTPLPNLAYIFRHFITREVAYNLMLFSQRRQLHQTVGRWYERNYGSDNSDYFEVMAYHYEKAEVWDKALLYLLKAGQKARVAYAYVEALNSYNRGVAAAEQLGDRVDADVLMSIYAGMGEVHFIQSNFVLSIETYQKMLSVARQWGDRHREAEALCNIAHGSMWEHEFEQALEYAALAKELAVEIGDDNIVAASVFVTDFTKGTTGKLDTLSSCNSEALAIATKMDNKGVLGFTLFAQELLHVWQGEYAAAVQMGDRGAALFQSPSFQFFLMIILWPKAMAYCCQGKYSLALLLLQQTLDITELLGDKIYQSRTLNTLGWVHIELYNLELGRAYNQRAMEIAYDLGEPEIIRNAEINLGDCDLLSGNLEGARSHLEKVYNDCQEQGKKGEQWMKWRYLQHCCHSLGELRLQEGDIQGALGLAEECLQLAEPTVSRKNLVKGWRLKGEALLAMGNVQEAGEFLQKAIALATEIGNPRQLWLTYESLAQWCEGQGLVSQGREARQQAVEIIDKVANDLKSVEIKQTFLKAASQLIINN